MDGELKQLLKIKNSGKCACFKTENDSRFQTWKVALAQRYGNLNPGLKFKAKIEGKIDDLVIKLNAEDAQLVTITLYPTNRSITIQENYMSELPKYEFTNVKELTDCVTEFDDIPWDNEWFLKNVLEAKAQKKHTKNGEPPASTVAKEQKSANDKVRESKEEIKNLQQAIELLENNCISLMTGNEELHNKVDDLTSRISQLEESLKAIEKGCNAKLEKGKQAQTKQQQLVNYSIIN